MDFIKKRVMPIFFTGQSKAEAGKSQPASSEGIAVLSKIETLPAELKLQIIENTANVSVVKQLVIACPSFHAVYCENKYRVLLNAHRKCQNKDSDVYATAVLNIHKFDGPEDLKMHNARDVWENSCHRGIHRQDQVSFVDSQPSLSELIQVSRVHCRVVENAEEYLRMAVKSEVLMASGRMYNLFEELYIYLYYIEIFAAVIGDRERGWPAASLPESNWERNIQDLWLESDFDKMSEVIKVIWPNRFSKTPPNRRRTRALIVRNHRSRRGDTISID